MWHSVFPTIRLAGSLLLPGRGRPRPGQCMWNGRQPAEWPSGEQARGGGWGAGGRCRSFRTVQKTNPNTQSHFHFTFDVVLSKGILHR